MSGASVQPTLPFLEILLRLFMAFGCGAVIGLNREFHHKPAEFRTFGLGVAAGAGQYAVAGAGMTPGFVLLWLGGPFERLLTRNRKRADSAQNGESEDAS